MMCELRIDINDIFVFSTNKNQGLCWYYGCVQANGVVDREV